MISAGLTAGAVLRVGLRVFTPLGDSAPNLKKEGLDQPDSQGQAISGDEEPETNHSKGKIPITMFIPVVFFIALALVPSLSLGFAERLNSAAVQFLASNHYISNVLEEPNTGFPKKALTSQTGTVIKDHRPELMVPSIRSLITLVFALLLGVTGLWTVPLTRKAKGGVLWTFRGIASFLHSVHSGQIGDYLTWLTVGIAIFWGYLYFKTT